jgi:hypothetical protein
MEKVDQQVVVSCDCHDRREPIVEFPILSTPADKSLVELPCAQKGLTCNPQTCAGRVSDEVPAYWIAGRQRTSQGSAGALLIQTEHIGVWQYGWLLSINLA